MEPGLWIRDNFLRIRIRQFFCFYLIIFPSRQDPDPDPRRSGSGSTALHGPVEEGVLTLQAAIEAFRREVFLSGDKLDRGGVLGGYNVE